ncbi:MAG: hypothetical protein AB2N28_4320 [Candidatus Phytoplasma solani]
MKKRKIIYKISLFYNLLLSFFIFLFYFIFLYKIYNFNKELIHIQKEIKKTHEEFKENIEAHFQLILLKQKINNLNLKIQIDKMENLPTNQTPQSPQNIINKNSQYT